jgi:hypothetical protein
MRQAKLCSTRPRSALPHHERARKHERVKLESEVTKAARHLSAFG